MKRALLAALLLCLVGLSADPALAKHRQVHHAKHGHRAIVAAPIVTDGWCRSQINGCHGASPAWEAYPKGSGKPRGIAGARSSRAAWNGSFGSLAARARAYMGETASDLGLPNRLWCADFMNKITGGGTGSRLARDYAHYGSPAAPGCVDCIAVLSRRGGAHVGVVTGYDASGNPIIVSGNHGHRVGEGVYDRRRVIAWRQV